MAKTRHKRKQKRKTRKQRGAGQYFVKGIQSKYKTYTISKEEGNTARKVLEKLIDRNFSHKTNYANTTPNVLPYRMKVKGKIFQMLEKKNWNEEEVWKNIVNSALPDKEALMEFIPVEARLQSYKNEKLEKAEKTFEIVKKGLRYLGAGKIILESAAAMPDIDKNVAQQFKFQVEPLSPIILIDWAFFSSPDDFYNLLNFTEINVEELGPRDIIRLYVKKEGQPLTIKDPKNAYQREYLKAVYSQAQEKNIDLKEEIKIMCISHDLSYESTNKNLSIANFLDENFSRTAFGLYNWERSNNKDTRDRGKVRTSSDDASPNTDVSTQV